MKVFFDVDDSPTVRQDTIQQALEQIEFSAHLTKDGRQANGRLPQFDNDSSSLAVDTTNLLCDVAKSKKTILIVNDSPLALAQLTDAFAEDYDLVSAESGEGAVEILEDPVRGDICFSNQFDLIITDLRMPGMSGFDLAAYVRKMNKVNNFTPVILLTSESISKAEVRKRGCSARFSYTDKRGLISMVDILLSF